MSAHSDGVSDPQLVHRPFGKPPLLRPRQPESCGDHGAELWQVGSFLSHYSLISLNRDAAVVYFVFFMLLHNFSFEGERSKFLVLHFFTVASWPKRPDSNNTKDVVQIHVFLSVVTKTLSELLAGHVPSYRLFPLISTTRFNKFVQIIGWMCVTPSAPAEVSRLIIRLIKSPDSIETGTVMDLTLTPSVLLSCDEPRTAWTFICKYRW